MKELSNRLYGHHKKMLLGISLALLQSALALPTALVIRRAFDDAVPRSDGKALAVAGLFLFALKLVSGILASFGHRVVLSVYKSVSLGLRNELLSKALNLPRQYYQQVTSGVTLDTLTAEMARIDTMIQALLAQVVPASFLSVSLAAVLFSLDVRLFCALVVLWPGTWLLNEIFRRRLVAATQAHNQAYRETVWHLQWVLRSLDFVRIRNAELQEETLAHRNYRRLEDSAVPMSCLQVDYLQLQGVLLMSLSLVVLFYGGSRVAQHEMTAGSLFSFFMVVGLLNGSLREVAAGLYHVVVGQESLDKVLAFLQVSEALPYQGLRKVQLEEALELQSVSFGYPSGPLLLKDFSLCLRRGQTVALTGANGCGKSTVLSLLLGFYAPQEGRILADGLEYRELAMGPLRAQIGVVSQDPLLFAGTIRENLLYAQPELSEEQLWQGLALADADNWVAMLPLKLETPVGDSGCQLSGGQRQKLAIARALAARPNFLVLDEPTNHLDLRAVEKILGFLKKLPQRPGILLVTHDEGVAKQSELRIHL